jgi:hypothetical protein
VAGGTLFVGVEAQDLILRAGRFVVMMEMETCGGEEQRMS